MPAKSQAQRAYLYARFGAAWAKRHGFDNTGSLPAHVRGDRHTQHMADFTAKQRNRLATTGAAMPDGSFPIRNGADLENAIRAVGRAKDPAAAKRHIVKRARALQMKGKIPLAWL